jgi:N4-gp56 family major capsid protein
MPNQNWAVSSDGGHLTNNRLSKQLRYASQPMQRFRQFVQVKEAFGANRGDTVFFDKIGNLNSAGGSLSESATMPETKFPVRKGSLVITEWGNSVPYTGKLETLAEFSVEDITSNVLRDDEAKVLDSAVAVQFTSGKLRAVASTTATTAITSDGAFTATASANLSSQNVRDIIDEMKRRNIPKWDGEHYVAICSTNHLRGLYDSLETVQQYTEAGSSQIPAGTFYAPMRGERGRYYGCRFNMEPLRKAA